MEPLYVTSHPLRWLGTWLFMSTVLPFYIFTTHGSFTNTITIGKLLQRCWFVSRLEEFLSSIIVKFCTRHHEFKFHLRVFFFFFFLER